MKHARPTISREVGLAAWMVLWRAWSVVTGPLLPTLTRIAIEPAVGLTAPTLLPILMVLNRVASLVSLTYLPIADKAMPAEITERLSTIRGGMLEPVQETPAIPSTVLVALQAEQG